MVEPCSRGPGIRPQPQDRPEAQRHYHEDTDEAYNRRKDDGPQEKKIALYKAVMEGALRKGRAYAISKDDFDFLLE